MYNIALSLNIYSKSFKGYTHSTEHLPFLEHWHLKEVEFQEEGAFRLSVPEEEILYFVINISVQMQSSKCLQEEMSKLF